MREYACASAVDALLRVGNDLILDPDFIVSPRGRQTHEIRNVTIQVNDPSDCTMTGIGRLWNPRIAVAEFLQLVGGFSNSEAMTRVHPSFADFQGDHGEFHGAYGVRTGDAMGWLVDRLQASPDTRQGVVNVWDNERDQAGFVAKDMPCTTDFNFTVREGQLLMTTHMRSNDVWRGWSYDAFQFMQLGWTIANFLEVGMGPYTHVVDSMHMYVDDMDAFYQLHPLEEHPERVRLHGLDSGGEPNWKDVQDVATDIFYTQDAKGETDSEQWMIDTGIAKVVHGSV